MHSKSLTSKLSQIQSINIIHFVISKVTAKYLHHHNEYVIKVLTSFDGQDRHFKICVRVKNSKF